MAVFAWLLLSIVIPIWLVLHYVTKWRSSRSLSGDDTKTLEDLWESARRMEDRIGNLETILESERSSGRK